MGSEGSEQGCWVVRWGNLRMMARGVVRDLATVRC